MKIILCIAGVFLLAYSAAASCEDDTPSESEPCNVIADIVFLFDASSSILAENYQKQFAFATSFASRFAIGPNNVRFGAAIFSHYTTKLFDLHDHDDLPSITAALQNVQYDNSSTYLDKALSFMGWWNMWGTENGGRTNAHKLLIIVTDGNPNRVSAAYKEAQKLKDQGITIVGIAVGHLILREILEQIASTPGDVFDCEDYDSFDAIEQLVAAHACDNDDCPAGYKQSADDPTQCADIDECSMDICDQNCENTDGSYVCSCDEGYVVNPDDTDKCDEIVPCESKADIGLVLDASASIGAENFTKQLTFAQRLVSHFPLGPNNFRIGAVVFSRTVEKVSDLTDDAEALKAALAATPFLNGSTYTHTAFLMLDFWDFWGTENGGRDDVPDSLILITDGNPNRKDETLEKATYLKETLGVTIMGVAIGEDIHRDVLEQITSSPDDIVECEDFNAFAAIEQRVAVMMCDHGKM